MILADMGAEVIKIERPNGGDRRRGTEPIIEKSDGRRVSAPFLAVNRNKKSVTLDLRVPRCKQVFQNMVREADVLLENWGPGALRRGGLGFDDLRLLNPRLVYASITGYGDGEGLRGPYSQWLANNGAVQGMGGLMQVTGPPDAPPQMVGEPIGDTVPGLWTALGIVLALETRRKTGLGQHVDMAMYDCLVAHTTESVPKYQATGYVTGRSHKGEQGRAISQATKLEANDGFAALSGTGGEEKWAALWRLIGRDELSQDPRYLCDGVSGEFYFDQIIPTIEAWSRHRSKWEVAEKLNGLGFSMGVVQDQADLDRCPHLEARNMFVRTGDGLGGSFRMVNTPIHLVGCVSTPARTPPLLGEHNREILCGIGGLTPGELDQLQADGAV
jgi:formyl-CoA transferase